jgi:predicted RNase H-like HicB family nuclease
MTTLEYIVRVHQEEDGGLWAEVLDLPGCFASGQSLDELREALEEAISLYLHDRPDAGVIKGLGRKKAPARPVPAHMEVGEMRVKVPA